MSGPDKNQTGGQDQPGGRPTGRVRPGRRALFSDPAGPDAAMGAESGRSASRAEEPTSGPASPDRPGGAWGRRAFFSQPVEPPAPDAPTPGSDDAEQVRPGLTTAVVVCRTCLSRTPMSLLGLGVSLVPSLWLPSRKWSRLMRCPACRRVSWCRVEWPSLRG